MWQRAHLINENQPIHLCTMCQSLFKFAQLRNPKSSIILLPEQRLTRIAQKCLTNFCSAFRGSVWNRASCCSAVHVTNTCASHVQVSGHWLGTHLSDRANEMASEASRYLELVHICAHKVKHAAQNLLQKPEKKKKLMERTQTVKRACWRRANNVLVHARG